MASKKLRRYRAPAAAIGAAALLVLSLAGCRGGETASAKRPTLPHSGGVLRIALDIPTDLDPALCDDSYEASVVKQIFSGLLRWDDDLNILPDIADSWIISRDGLTYDFDLRRDARFHNGRTVTAEDFVYSFTRLLDAQRVSPSIIQDYMLWIDGAQEYAEGRADEVRGLTAPGPHRLRIHLHAPYPSFLSVLCMDQARVVPAEEVELEGATAFARNPVGSGPFRFAGADEAAIRLVRNPDYYGVPAYLDTLTFINYPPEQSESVKADLIAGRVDLCELRTNEIDELVRNSATTVLRRPELSLEFLGFNVTRPPLDRTEVRRALALAVDREFLARIAGPGYVAPAGLLPPGVSGFTPESKILSEDEAAARKMLTDLGYGPGHPLRFQIATASRGNHGALRDSVIAESFRRVGVEVTFRYVEWGEFSRLINSHGADAYILSWIADLPDPDSFLFTLFSSRGTYNLFGYSSGVVDDLLDQGRTELNRTVRLDLYRGAERTILEDAALVPLFTTVNLIAFRTDVRGVEMSPIGLSGIMLSRIWLAPGQPEVIHAGL